MVGDPSDPLVAEIRAGLPADVGFFSTIADALVAAQTAWNPGEERVIEIVDSEEKINTFLPVLDKMIGGGLVTLEKVRVLHYRSGEAEK